MAENINALIRRRFSDKQLREIRADALCEIAVSETHAVDGVEGEWAERLYQLAGAVLEHFEEDRVRRAWLSYLCTWIEVWRDDYQSDETFQTIVCLAVKCLGRSVVAEHLSVSPTTVSRWQDGGALPVHSSRDRAVECIRKAALERVEALGGDNEY